MTHNCIRTVLVIALVAVSNLYAPQAYATTGYLGTTFSDYAGTDHTPYLSGVFGGGCSNITVSISPDKYDFQQGGHSKYVFRSSNGAVAYNLSGTGEWSLYPEFSGVSFENGVYSAQVSCDDPHTYTAGGRTITYYISDTYEDVVYIYPQSCSDTSTNCVPVYRFYNLIEGSHFYTAVNYEKHTLAGMPYKYRYEGIVGFASSIQYDSGLAVHRFYNKRTGTHFYTASQTEATNVNDSMGATYRYEGIAYYADAQQQYDSIPMHRFYKFKQGVHFYTASQTEATNVNDSMASTYRYEGIPFYIINNI